MSGWCQEVVHWSTNSCRCVHWLKGFVKIGPNPFQHWLSNYTYSSILVFIEIQLLSLTNVLHLCKNETDFNLWSVIWLKNSFVKCREHIARPSLLFETVPPPRVPPTLLKHWNRNPAKFAPTSRPSWVLSTTIGRWEIKVVLKALLVSQRRALI